MEIANLVGVASELLIMTSSIVFGQWLRDARRRAGFNEIGAFERFSGVAYSTILDKSIYRCEKS